MKTADTVYQLIKASTAIKAIVGDAIYELEEVDSSLRYPCVVIEVEENEESDLSGPTGVLDGEITVTAMSANKTQAASLINLVNGVLNGVHVGDVQLIWRDENKNQKSSVTRLDNGGRIYAEEVYLLSCINR